MLGAFLITAAIGAPPHVGRPPPPPLKLPRTETSAPPAAIGAWWNDPQPCPAGTALQSSANPTSRPPRARCNRFNVRRQAASLWKPCGSPHQDSALSITFTG